MEHDFKSEEWARLSTAERVHRCHVLAAEARDLATDAPPQAKRHYLEIAEQWTALAGEIQKAASGANAAKGFAPE